MNPPGRASRFLIALSLFYLLVSLGCGGGGGTSIVLPAAPGSVQIVVGNGIVTVTWVGVTGATAYHIYWKAGAGITKQNSTKVPNVTSPRVQTGLTNGTNYCFRVVAANASGESLLSEEKCGTPTAPTLPPAAPINVRATSGDGQVTLTWDAVPGATTYNLYWRTSAGVTRQNGTQIPNVTSPSVHGGLTNGTTYYYMVTASNAAGESPESLETSTTPWPAGVLPGPANDPANSHIPDMPFPALDDNNYVIMEGFAISFKEFLLVLKSATTVQEANQLLTSVNAAVTGGLPVGGLLLVQVPLQNLNAMMALLNTLNRDPRVTRALPEMGGTPESLPPLNVTPNLWDWQVPDYSASPPPRPATDGNWGLEMIRVPQMWNLDTFVRRHRAGNPVSAGIVDAGFTDNLAAAGPSTHPGFIRRNATVILQIAPNAGGGAVPVNDHGTMVAGIIGAAWDNNINPAGNGQVGVEGVNPWLTAIQARASVFQGNDHTTWGRQINNIMALLQGDASIKAVNNSYGLSGTYVNFDNADNGAHDGSFNPQFAEFGEFNGNGNHRDISWRDTNPNGNFDFTDTNGNGIYDPGEPSEPIRALEFGVDTDGDGLADTGFDVDGDGNSTDTWRQVADFYGDLFDWQASPFINNTRGDFFVVASAGNAGSNYQSRDNSAIGNLADPGHPNFNSRPSAGHFLSVESINWNNAASSFSDLGGSISAPGECIRSTEATNAPAAANYDDKVNNASGAPGADGVADCLAGNPMGWWDGAGSGNAQDLNYATSSGTSFAAPFVTGLVSALWKLQPALPSQELRNLLTNPSFTLATTGGTQRRVDAFSAAMGIDIVMDDATKTMQRALVNVDDGTLDGNQRTIRDDGGAEIGTYIAVDTPDSLRGDERDPDPLNWISMRDFRVLRDATTQALLEDGTLGQGVVSLDGPPGHFKRDLNFDGCVGTQTALPSHPAGTVPVPPDPPGCANAPAERTFSRYDFNGDGTAGWGKTKFKGNADWTDLDVLKDLWPEGQGDLTEGWNSTDLSALLPQLDGTGGSGDLDVRVFFPLGGTNPMDEARLTIQGVQQGQAMTRILTSADSRLVWTVPMGTPLTVTAEGFKAGVKVEDLCLSPPSPLAPLKHAEDRVIRVGPCGKSGFVNYSQFNSNNSWGALNSGNAGGQIFDDYFWIRGDFQDVKCFDLQVGETCSYTPETFPGTYTNGGFSATIARVGQYQWRVTATMNLTPATPPLPAPAYIGCGGWDNDLGDGVQCQANSGLGPSFRINLYTGLTGLADYNVSCSAAGGFDQWPVDAGVYANTAFNVQVGVGGVLQECEGFVSAPFNPWSVNKQNVAFQLFRWPSDGGHYVWIDLWGGASAHRFETFYNGDYNSNPKGDYSWQQSVSETLTLDVTITPAN